MGSYIHPVTGKKSTSPRIFKTCPCGKEYYGSPYHDKNSCPSCRAKYGLVVLHLVPREGDKNPAWKGGHKYWQAGKYGRDKDGLSWKQQRQLTWERDFYTCQHCGKCCESWKPDVHHRVPYRLSFSHALKNLICLCRRCHKKEEAKIKELWGGITFGGHFSRRTNSKFHALRAEVD